MTGLKLRITTKHLQSAPKKPILTMLNLRHLVYPPKRRRADPGSPPPGSLNFPLQLVPAGGNKFSGMSLVHVRARE